MAVMVQHHRGRHVEPNGCTYELGIDPHGESELCGKTSVVKLRNRQTQATLRLCAVHWSNGKRKWAEKHGWEVIVGNDYGK